MKTTQPKRASSRSRNSSAAEREKEKVSLTRKEKSLFSQTGGGGGSVGWREEKKGWSGVSREKGNGFHERDAESKNGEKLPDPMD